MNYINVTNPKWSNEEHTIIDCEVTFENLGTVPFTANPLDTSNPSSKQIFDECKAGDYGVIAKYVAPPPLQDLPQPTISDLQAQLADIAAKLQALQGAA